MGRRAGIAMIVALMAPVLLAVTGLSVDVGYWYQQQESLQSAADAAVMATANAAVKYGIASTAVSSFASSTGQSFAVAAANDATNGQYSFATSGNAVVTVSASAGTSTVTWTATATIPRGSFFSPVRGEGLAGVVAGSQSAQAQAQYGLGAKPSNIYVSGCAAGGTGGINVSGGATVESTNGAIYSGCATCPSITVSGSGKVIGADGVDTPASCVATNGGSQTTSTNNGSGYIGTQTSGTPNNGNTSSASPSSATQTDPLAALNAANTVLWDPGITVPAIPSGATTAYNLSSDLSSEWNPLTDASKGTACDTTYESHSFPQGSCGTDVALLGANAYLTGMTNVQLSGSGTWGGYTLFPSTSGWETVIEGGFNGQMNNSGNLNLRDSTYYISGGMTMGVNNGLYFGTGSSTMNVTVTGGMTLNDAGSSSTQATFYPGSYIISQAAAGSTPSGYALNINVPNLTLEGSTYQVYGGAQTEGSTTNTYMQSGLYEFEGASSTYATSCSQYYCGSGAYYAQEGAVTFGTAVTPASSAGAGSCGSTPSTWFFNGGLTLGGGTTNVTFCPGIYYIKNGFLYIGSGTTITGTGVTFVLEGNAGFIFNGGATVNLSAPTSSCVSTTAFPEIAYNGTSPYDGTDGEGICGIVIYQSRTDTTADYVGEGAGSSFNGGIYAPNAPLTVSGGAALTITSSGVPDLVVGSINDSGSGNINVTENNPPSGGGGGAGTAAMLTQ